MIEKIKLDNQMLNELISHDEKLGVIQKRFAEMSKELSDSTTTRIINNVLDEYYNKIGNAGIKEDYLRSIVSSVVRELSYEKDDELRSFNSRAHSIINGCMPNNHELVASYMIEKLDENVTSYTSTPREDKLNTKIINRIIEKITEHVAVHQAFSTDYRNNYQASFESFVKKVVEKEISNYQTELNDYYYDTVYSNVKEVTNAVIEYFYPMVQQKSQVQEDLAKSFK